MVPSSSLIVGIVGACEAGVGSVDTVAGVFCGVGAVARSSTRRFLMNCFSDIVNYRLRADRKMRELSFSRSMERKKSLDFPRRFFLCEGILSRLAQPKIIG